MKRLLLCLAASAGLAAFADLGGALDCPNLTFSTGGDADWFEQTAEFHSGGSALRSGGIDDDEETWVEATASETCRLSFWWRTSSEMDCDELAVFVDGEQMHSISGDTGWRQVQLPVMAGQTIRWAYCKDGSASESRDCGWLDGVSAEPAPETMTYRLVANGGGEFEPIVLKPGDTADALPVPKKEGSTFGGWFYDEGFAEGATGLLRFEDGVLYARWYMPVSIFDTEYLTFNDLSGSGEWEAVETEDGPALQNKGANGYCLSVTVPNSAGTLTFKYKQNRSAIFSASPYGNNFWPNGIGGYHSFYENTDGDWTQTSIYFLGTAWADTQDVTLTVGVYDYGVPSLMAPMFKDFEWTPAPATMTYSFEANGGGEFEPMVLNPGDTIDALPVPKKEGSTFVGWFYDEELTEKVEGYIRLSDETLYAKWVIPASYLDTDEIRFIDNNYNNEWEAAETDDGLVLMNRTMEGSELGITIPNGAGMLKFKCKRSTGSELSVSMNSDAIWGDGVVGSRYFYGRSDGDWVQMQLSFYGEGPEDGHGIFLRAWYYYYEDTDASGKSLMFKDFEWIPAPETVTISFYTMCEGCEAIKPIEVSTSANDWTSLLPTPTASNGWKFNGWSLESGVFARKVGVPFEDTTLYACWIKPVSALDTESLKFTSVGNWFVEYDEDYGGDYAEGSLIEGGVVAKNYKPKKTTSTMSATVTGPAVLIFNLETWECGAYIEDCSGLDQYCTVIAPEDKNNVLSFGESTFKLYLDKTVQLSCCEDEEYYGRYRLYIPSGKHTVKWELSGTPHMFKMPVYDEDEYYEEDDEVNIVDWKYYAANSRSAIVSEFDFAMAGPQESLADWVSLEREYGSWVTGDLAKFAKEYKTRIAADPEDYEARILHAVSILGNLAENKQFQTYAKTFGYSIDWTLMTVKGSPTLNAKTAAVNTIIDKTISLATPVVAEALADLEAIPRDWEGGVTLSADKWPIDEDVVIDIADVLFAKASLNAAVASLNYLGAYDLTVDWAKVNGELNLKRKIPVVKSVPAIGAGESWEKSGLAFRTMASSFEMEDGWDEYEDDGDEMDEQPIKPMGSAVIKGSTLSLRLTNPKEWCADNQVRQVKFKLKDTTGRYEIGINAKVHGENGPWQERWRYYYDEYNPNFYECYYTNGGGYDSKTNVTCSVWTYDRSNDDENDLKATATIAIRSNELVLNVNLGKYKDFAKKTWTMCNGHTESGYWIEREEYEDEDDDSWEDEDEDEDAVRYDWFPVSTVEWYAPTVKEMQIQKFIGENPSFFSKVRNNSRLGIAYASAKSALQLAIAADEKAMARAQDGVMHFVEYDPDNEALINFARENTILALESLDSPVDFDLPATLQDYDDARNARFELKQKYKTSRCAEKRDWTLFGDNGVAQVFLGAIFNGKLNRSYMPDTRLNAYGEIVPNFDELNGKDPTFCGILPGMEFNNLVAFAESCADGWELDHTFWVEPATEELPKPGEAVRQIYADYAGYTASGLQKGWKWDKATGTITGTASEKFVVTLAKGSDKAKILMAVGEKPVVSLAVDNDAAVCVTGYGAYSVNAITKVTAAVMPGYAFGGWYEEDDLVSTSAAYSFKMPARDVALEARTVALADDFLEIEAEGPVEVPLKAEFSLEEPFTIYSASPVSSVAASGLPKGLSLKKNEDGFHVVTGKATVKGVYYATFSAKNNGGFKRSATVRYIVGGAVEGEANAAGLDFSDFEKGDLETGVYYEFAAEVPDSAKGSKPKSVAVKGLPSGIKAEFREGELRFGGVAAKPGKHTITVTVTYANKTKAETKKTFIVRDGGCRYVKVGVAPCGAVGNRGTATGGGVLAMGSTVTFTAKSAAAKKFFFTGWYGDEGCNEPLARIGKEKWKEAAATFQLTEETLAEAAYAQFITKEEELYYIDCDDGWRVEGAESALPIEFGSSTKATLAASGLPKGTKLSGASLVVSALGSLVPGYYSVTLTLTTTAGNKVSRVVGVTVPNITTATEMELLELDTSDEGYGGDEYGFMQAGVKQSFTLEDMGIAVADGWTLAVTGLPNGWTYNAATKKIGGTAAASGKKTVTFTVKKGKASYNATATFDLAALPEWAVGKFSGVTTLGYVAFDVSAGGAASGFYLKNGAKVAFTAKDFAWAEDGSLVAATKDAKGKASPLGTLALGEGEITLSGSGGSIVRQSPWSRAGAEEALPVFDGAPTKSIKVGKGTLSLKFGAKGVVTCTFAVGGNKPSMSSQISDMEYIGGSWVARVAVSTAKKNAAAAFACVVEATLVPNECGLVDADGITLGEPVTFAEYLFGLE